MLVIRDSQMQQIANASPGTHMIAPCPASRTWIEIRLVDQDGRPVAGERYQLRLPDTSLMEGTLDADGAARYEGIVVGQCHVSFPGFEAQEWKKI